MIPVNRDQILLRFARIPTEKEIPGSLHKLRPVITCKTFHPCKTGSLFCTAGIPLCRDVIFSCNRFSPRRGDKKVNWKISIEVHFNRSSIFLLCFYDSYDVNLWEKKSINIFVDFHHYAESGSVLQKRCS